MTAQPTPSPVRKIRTSSFSRLGESIRQAQRVVGPFRFVRGVIEEKERLHAVVVPPAAAARMGVTAARPAGSYGLTCGRPGFRAGAYDLRRMARTLREKIHNPFDWACNCDPGCWCRTTR